jgi:hypothetical protein
LRLVTVNAPTTYREEWLASTHVWEREEGIEQGRGRKKLKEKEPQGRMGEEFQDGEGGMQRAGGLLLAMHRRRSHY